MKLTYKNSSKITVTAATLEEIEKLIADLVVQGWHSESNPVQNPDSSYTVVMVKDS
ncbi:MAG: hypothetical protein SGI89_07715 [bacterium]|nr:hypothetical protein [bacterium]